MEVDITKDSDKKCWLYWIYLPHLHTDILTQGYVGITTRGVGKRWSCHKSHARRGKKTRLYDAMRKYGDGVAVRVIIESSLEYCQLIENKLRSGHNIGWNTGVGGERPTVGFQHTDETKRVIAASGRGRKKTEECKAVIGRHHRGKVVSEETRKRQSEARKAKRQKPWENAAANREVWAIALSITEYIGINPSQGIYLIGKAFGLSQDKVSKITAYVKSGWNPSQDQAYMAWLTEYNKT